MNIPNQLKNPEFRFFLLQKNGKIPIEKKYNTTNSYPFFHSKLLSHQGNIAILTGIGNLIVLDFDDKAYYKSMKTLKSMPNTFCVKTARKGLYHLYYMLYGEMFKTQGIDINNQRVVDIMGDNGKVVCPPSTIDDKPYKVVTDVPIATITLAQLQSVFKFCPEKKREYKDHNHANNPALFNYVVEEFRRQGIERYNAHKFRCPFHESDSQSSLYLFDDGGIRCFHCERYFSNIKYFIKELNEYRRDNNIMRFE